MLSMTCDRNAVCPGLGEGSKIRVGRGDHQVHVERECRDLPDGLDDDRAHREVRHEMAVHNVDVQPVRAGALDSPYFVAQP